MSPVILQYFLDDFWNFDIFVKIWTRGPPNYHQNSPKHTRKMWEHLGKYYFPCLTTKIFDFVRKVNPHFFEFIFLDIIFVYFWVYSFKIILRRWGTENATCSITKHHKSLDMNFISIKNMKRGFCNFVTFRKGLLKLLYFPGRFPKLFCFQER